MMLIFSERKELGEIFEKWAKDFKAKDCAFNVITFLEMSGLLDVERVKKYLEVWKGGSND